MSDTKDIEALVVEEDKVQPAPPQGRGDHPVITGDTARQGPAGWRVLYILSIGFAGALIALAIAYFVWAS